MIVLFHRLVTWFWFRWISRVICQHFCLFKQAGSNFKNCHVHILGTGEYEATSNPHGYTGLGHDDETPGLSNPGDEKHNSVSTSDSIGFRRNPDGTTLYPIQLQARAYGQAYFHPAPEEGDCPPGFFRVKCDCGDACATFDYDAYTRWRKVQ